MTTPALATAWSTLDRFEGPEYQRILVAVCRTALRYGQTGEWRLSTVSPTAMPRLRPVPVQPSSRVSLERRAFLEYGASNEPAAALDPMGRRDVLEVMERLCKHTTIFYSTHILEDVQRVSDTVAIMALRKLLTQAPITELLAGRGGAVYLLTLTGDAEAARARLAQ